MNIMKDYYDLYLKVEVLLLDCVFETFRKESIGFFKLNPGHYLSNPDYGFTGVNIILILDIEKYEVLGSTTRGGISMICKGYAAASNKFLKSYDNSKPK